MKLISIIAFATAALALATPEAVPQAGSTKPLRFTGKALRPASPIDSGSINANGGKFWIGKKTKTHCPKDNPAIADACKHVNKHQTIFDYLNDEPTLFMDTRAPSGQQVYVNKDTGRLRFTPTHSAQKVGTPKEKGFSIVYDARFQFEKKDWIACPDGTKGTYGIFAAAYKKADKECFRFTWKVEQVEDSVPTAWQYE